MTWESQYTTMFLDPAAFVRSNPATRASYSALLLVVGKSRRTMDSISSPYGERSTIPTPPAYLLDDLSMWILQ